MSEHKEYMELDEHTRIYYTSSEYGPGFGFNAEVLKVIDRPSDEPPFGENSVYERIVTVYALWDGIRHIYFHTEGYFYYPNFNYIKLVLDKLSELEKKYCRETSTSEKYD